jgi:hypothetical protein
MHARRGQGRSKGSGIETIRSIEDPLDGILKLLQAELPSDVVELGEADGAFVPVIMESHSRDRRLTHYQTFWPRA